MFRLLISFAFSFFGGGLIYFRSPKADVTYLILTLEYILMELGWLLPNLR